MGFPGNSCLPLNPIEPAPEQEIIDTFFFTGGLQGFSNDRTKLLPVHRLRGYHCTGTGGNL